MDLLRNVDFETFHLHSFLSSLDCVSGPLDQYLDGNHSISYLRNCLSSSSVNSLASVFACQKLLFSANKYYCYPNWE